MVHRNISMSISSCEEHFPNLGEHLGVMQYMLVREGVPEAASFRVELTKIDDEPYLEMSAWHGGGRYVVRVPRDEYL